MNDRIGERTPGGESRKTAPPAAGGRWGVKRIFWKAVGGVSEVFNLAPDVPHGSRRSADDVGTRLAHKRTNLALERSYMAADRTLMAWIRTALSMISFGFTIGKLGQAINQVSVGGTFGLGKNRSVSIESLAYFLVILGTLALLGATVQHWLQVREFRAMGLRRRISIGFIVALLLTFVGGFALSALVLKL